MPRNPTHRALCECCVRDASVLHAAGATMVAATRHYAMALVMQAHAEGHTLCELIAFLDLIYDAPEIVARVTPLASVRERV